MLTAKLSVTLISFALCVKGIYGFSPNVILPWLRSNDDRFQWDDIAPSPRLQYHECYDDFECARLIVPLDWKNASNSNNVSLAVIRLPATVPEDHPSHGGSIIINPGGPGGSGIQYAVGTARKMQQLLNGTKRYEIVSFDPRGVLYSKPNAFCFSTAFESEIWWREKRTAGNIDKSEDVLKFHWAMDEARGKLCEMTQSGRFENGDNLHRFVSTAYVARDMLELTHKIEEHRSFAKATSSQNNDAQIALQADPLTRPSAKLQFIGSSYGTFLGQTFGSMYPEHVHRMILDSNLDGDNWVSKYHASVGDQEDIRDYFFKRCFDANSACALYRNSDSSKQDILHRYDTIVSALTKNPVAVTHGHVDIITPDDLEQGFFTAQYQPLLFFDNFANFLNDLFIGVEPNRRFFSFWQHPLPKSDNGIDENLAYGYHQDEVSFAVHCSDGPDLSKESFAGFQCLLKNYTSRFPNAGAVQAEWKLPCWTLPPSLRTNWRYSGPFGGPVPIFFINNRLDPVTPLKNARKMANQFHGSALLRHNKIGHGAMWPVNDCVWKYVATYMDNGTLPLDDAECDFPCEPFDDTCQVDWPSQLRLR